MGGLHRSTGPQAEKIPCIFPRNTNEFADDCFHRQDAFVSKGFMAVSKLYPYLYRTTFPVRRDLCSGNGLLDSQVPRQRTAVSDAPRFGWQFGWQLLAPNSRQRAASAKRSPGHGGTGPGLPVPLGGTCDGEGKPITRLAYTRCAFPATEVQISLSAILSPPSRRGYPILWQLRFARRRLRGNGKRSKLGTVPGLFFFR